MSIPIRVVSGILCRSTEMNSKTMTLPTLLPGTGDSQHTRIKLG